MSTLRLMSHNQWNYTFNTPAWEEMGLDCSAEVRMRGHVRVFSELLPDIVGGQEINKDMQRYFKFYCMEEGLPYTQIWGNYTPLIYRADKLELLDTEYLLYPVKVEGYEGEFNDSLSKSLNLGVFRNKESGKVFLFATTHLWWMQEYDPTKSTYRKGSDHVRTLQIKEAIAKIEKYRLKYKNCPAIFVGDMNTNYNSEAIQYALNEGGYKHAHDIATEYRYEGHGLHRCGPTGYGPWEEAPFEEAIDHILVKGLSDDAVRRFDRYMPEYYLTLSDHAPVYVDVEL